MAFDIIFGLWTSPKCDLGEVKEAKFLVVARHCELFFFLLLNQPKICLE